jgi:hypothetical protein
VEGLLVTADASSLKVRHGTLEVRLPWLGDDDIAWRVGLSNPIPRWRIDAETWPGGKPLRLTLPNIVCPCPSGRFALMIYAVQEPRMGVTLGWPAILRGPDRSPSLYATLHPTSCALLDHYPGWLVDTPTNVIFSAGVYLASAASQAFELALFDVMERATALVLGASEYRVVLPSITEQGFVLRSKDGTTRGVAYRDLHWRSWQEPNT